MPKETEQAQDRSFDTTNDAGSALLDLMGDRDVDAFDDSENDQTSEVEAEAEATDSDSTESEAEEEAGATEEEAEAESEAEATDEESTSDETEEEPTFTVRVDGKDVDVTLDELKSGYSFTAVNTRKSQELAARRKEVDAEAATVREEREKYARSLQLLEQAIADTLPPEPDWDKLREEDPARYAAAHADWQRRRSQLETVQAERQKAFSKQAEDGQREFQKTLAEEREKLISAIPEWKDEGTAKAEKERMVEYARDLGFADEQIVAVADHRVFLMLRKAMLYDSLQTKGRAAVEKGKQKPKKPLQPGGKKTTDAKSKKSEADTPDVRARKRLRSSGRPADAAQAIEGLIE